MEFLVTISNINVLAGKKGSGYENVIRIIMLAPVPTLNFDFGFFWPDLPTFYVSFGSFAVEVEVNIVNIPR